MRPPTILLFIVTPYLVQCSSSEGDSSAADRDASASGESRDLSDGGNTEGIEETSAGSSFSTATTTDGGGAADSSGAPTSDGTGNTASSPDTSATGSDATSSRSSSHSSSDSGGGTSGREEGASDTSHTSTGSGQPSADSETDLESSTSTTTSNSSSSAPTPSNSSASNTEASSLDPDESTNAGSDASTEGSGTSGTTEGSGVDATTPPDETHANPPLQCPPGRREQLQVESDGGSDTEVNGEIDAGSPSGLDPIYEDLALLLKMNDAPLQAPQRFCDSSGLGNHGTRFGTVSLTPNGKYGSAATFDGASWISVTDHESLRPTGAVTLSAWVRLSSLTNGQAPGIVAKRRGYMVESSYALFLFEENRAYVDVDFESERFASQQVFETGAWYHLVVVFDGSLEPTQRVRLYVNGVLDTTGSETATSLSPSEAPLEVGRLVNGGNYLHGLVDEVALWTRPLTPEEVSILPSLDL